jgi:hypothetical protein
MKEVCEFTTEDDYEKAVILLSVKRKFYIVERIDKKGHPLEPTIFGWRYEHEQRKALLEAINCAERHVPSRPAEDS